MNEFTAAARRAPDDAETAYTLFPCERTCSTAGVKSPSAESSYASSKSSRSAITTKSTPSITSTAFSTKTVVFWCRCASFIRS